MELFGKNIYRLSAGNYFHQKPHLKCSTGFWMHLWFVFWDSPFCLITDDIRYPLSQFQSWKKEVNFFLVTSTGRCSFYLIATQCVPSALAWSTLSHFSLFNLSLLHFTFAYSLLPVSSPRSVICLKHIKCVFKWRT